MKSMFNVYRHLGVHKGIFASPRLKQSGLGNSQRACRCLAFSARRGQDRLQLTDRIPDGNRTDRDTGTRQLELKSGQYHSQRISFLPTAFNLAV